MIKKTLIKKVGRNIFILFRNVVFKKKKMMLSFRRVILYPIENQKKKKMLPNFKRFRRFVDVTNGVCWPLGKKTTPERLLTAKSCTTTLG